MVPWAGRAGKPHCSPPYRGLGQCEPSLFLLSSSRDLQVREERLYQASEDGYKYHLPNLRLWGKRATVKNHCTRQLFKSSPRT